MARAPYTPPVISVTQEGSEYVLTATNHSRTAIAGERLFRQEPHPEIKFRHSSQADALRDAETLRVYLAECVSGKIKEKAKPVGRGWWED